MVRAPHSPAPSRSMTVPSTAFAAPTRTPRTNEPVTLTVKAPHRNSESWREGVQGERAAVSGGDGCSATPGCMSTAGAAGRHGRAEDVQAPRVLVLVDVAAGEPVSEGLLRRRA